MRPALLLAALLALASCKPSAPPSHGDASQPEKLGQLPAFTLTSQEGQPFGLAQLQSKVWVASFLFTRCPSICPRIVGRVQQLQAKSAELGPDFRLVSVSVDPEYDTPTVLRAYAEKAHADPARWTFLTGKTDAIEAVVTGGFKEVLEREGKKGPEDFLSIVHGGHLVLVDGQGEIRGYYDSADPAALDALLRDARTLLAR